MEITIKKQVSLSAISGPDTMGRIAFIDDNIGLPSSTYSLNVINLNTKAEDKIFTRKGSYWTYEDEDHGESFSLSDNGGLVALIKNVDAAEALVKNAYVHIGELDIVNINNGDVVNTGIKALDKGVDWFPDGKTLAYVELVPIGELHLDLEFNDEFGSEMKLWHSIPVVTLLNIEDLSKKHLHIGWNPIVSNNGLSIIIQDYQGRIRLYNMLNGNSKPVILPAAEQAHIFSLIGEDVILYRGLPTKGSKQKFRYTSTFGTTPYWTLKIANLNTSQFQTIISYLDIHRKISFGKTAVH